MRVMPDRVMPPFVVCVVIYSLISVITAKPKPSGMFVVTAEQEPSNIIKNYNKSSYNDGPEGGGNTLITPNLNQKLRSSLTTIYINGIEPLNLLDKIL